MRTSLMLKPCMRAAAITVAAVASVTAFAAESFPSRPIRILTTSSGGGSDFVARAIANGISGPLGQPVIVENRGGGATLSAEIAAKAQPNGHTLLVAANSLWIGPLFQKAPYDAIRDFAPITLAVNTANVLVVHPTVAGSIKELIAVAKAKPGALNYGSGATGASSHLAAELFKYMAGVNIVRVPYKGSGLAVNGVIGNEVQMMFPNASLVVGHIKANRLRGLAVTSSEPSAVLPELPTVAASGLPGYASDLYTGVFAPAGTPAPIINRLHQEIVRYLSTAEAKNSLLKAGGSEVVGSTPAQTLARMKAEVGRLTQLIKDTGMKAE